ncbi:MAG: hypothetical protein JJV97_06390 [SAR324 cluster bacterium]|nr:hypothetical protein [SAR324 cluster bacterium]
MKNIFLTIILIFISTTSINSQVIRYQNFSPQINKKKSELSSNIAVEELEIAKKGGRILPQSDRIYKVLEGVYSTNNKNITDTQLAVGNFFGKKLYTKNNLSLQTLSATNKKEVTTELDTWGVDKFYVINELYGNIGLVDGNIFVYFRGDIDAAYMVDSYGVTLENTFKSSNAARYKIKPGHDILAELNKILKDENVVSAHLIINDTSLVPF